MRWGRRYAVDARQIAELERLALWVRFTEEDKRIEVLPLLRGETAALAERFVKERDIEAKVVTNQDCSLCEVGKLLGRLLWRDPLLQVSRGDAVHLCAHDWVASIDERAPTVGDLATLDLHGSNLNEIRKLRIQSGGLRINHDECTAVCSGLCEGEDTIDARLNVWNALCLPYLCAQLLLQ